MLWLTNHVYKIPNEVTDYYLQRVGFECEDVRLCVPILHLRNDLPISLLPFHIVSDCFP